MDTVSIRYPHRILPSIPGNDIKDCKGVALEELSYSAGALGNAVIAAVAVESW
jgi:hypothetical protein